MKRKTMTLFLSLLAVLALVSVGFASWVISIDATGENTGTITVDTVTDNRVDIVVSWQDNKNTIYFGGPTADDKSGITNPWLTNSESKVECLTVTANVKVYKKGSTQEDANLVDLTSDSVAFEVIDNTNGGFASAVNNNYVVAPTVANRLTKTDNTTGTYTVTITFAWGTAFNSNNPYVYYNALTANDENASAAQTALSELETLLTGVTYKLTITGKQ